MVIDAPAVWPHNGRRRFEFVSRIALFVAAAAMLLLGACGRDAGHYLAKGNEFYEAKNFADASIQYRKAIQKDPNLGEAYYRLGRSELEQRKVEEALQALSRATQVAPDLLEAKVHLANLALAIYAGSPQSREAAYGIVAAQADALLTKDPKSVGGLRLRGQLAMLDRNPAAAVEYLRQANEIQPGQRDTVLSYVQALIQAGKAEEGEKLGRELIGSDPGFGAMYEVLYRYYAAANRLQDAEQILTQRIANNPKEAVGLLQLAGHHARRKDTAKMNAALERILANPAGFPDGRMQVGDFYAGTLRDWDQALRLYEEGARTDAARNADYSRKIAGVQAARGDRDAALRTLEETVAAHPDDRQSRILLGDLLASSQKQEDLRKAVASYQAAAGQDRAGTELEFKLGRAYTGLRDFDNARKHLQNALQEGPAHVPSRLLLAGIAIRERKPAEALSHAEQALRIEPQNPRASFLHAIALTQSSRFDEARGELTALERRFPRSNDVQMQLALLAMAEKKYSQAEAILSKLSADDPRAAAALAETYVAQQQSDRALELLRKESAESPDSLIVRRLLARTLAQAGRYDDSIKEYEALIARDPQSAATIMQLGDVYRLKRDVPRAKEQYRKAQAAAPKSPLPHLFLAMAEEHEGNLTEAIRGYRRVLEMQPDNPLAMNNLAFVLAQSGGSLDEALELARRAAERYPEQDNIQDTLGWVYLKKGMNDSALQIFTRLTARNPDSGMFHYHLGAAHWAKGDAAGARAAIDTALAKGLSPNDEREARELRNRIG
jgi:tetratricopeptide (TPR) repeat protein